MQPLGRPQIIRQLAHLALSVFCLNQIVAFRSWAARLLQGIQLLSYVELLLPQHSLPPVDTVVSAVGANSWPTITFWLTYALLLSNAAAAASAAAACAAAASAAAASAAAVLLPPVVTVVSAMGTNSWLTIIINNMLSGTALSNSTSSGASPAAAKAAAAAKHISMQSTRAILLSGIPALCASVAMVITAWHADRVNEKNWHVAVPYLIGGIALTLFTPLYKVSFTAGFVILVVALTFANAAMGVINARVVGECLGVDKYGARGRSAVYCGAW